MAAFLCPMRLMNQNTFCNTTSVPRRNSIRADEELKMPEGNDPSDNDEEYIPPVRTAKSQRRMKDDDSDSHQIHVK